MAITIEVNWRTKGSTVNASATERTPGVAVVESIDCKCGCGHSWRAHESKDGRRGTFRMLAHGQVILRCPKCNGEYSGDVGQLAPVGSG